MISSLGRWGAILGSASLVVGVAKFASFDCASFGCASFDCASFDCASFDCASFDCAWCKLSLFRLPCVLWA